MVGGAGARHLGFKEGVEALLLTCSDGALSTSFARLSRMSHVAETLKV